MRNGRTYIVHVPDGSGVQSMTLKDYCVLIGLNYNTVLARIWRSVPDKTSGVIYFETDDVNLQESWQQAGNPELTKKTAPRHRPENKVRSPKHSTLRPGKYNNELK